VLGPTLFNINSSTLSPISAENEYFKYADDAYLVVPASNTSTIPDELQHHSNWAAECNLKLNMTKTSEIVFCNRKVTPPAPHPGVERVDSLKVLGVIVDNKLTFKQHVSTTLTSCSNVLFALRTLTHHGLSAELVRSVYKGSIVAKLLYASPAWWGFSNQQTRSQINAFLRKSVRLNFCDHNQSDFNTLCEAADAILFKSVTGNPQHALHHLLPPLRDSHYNLRSRKHNFSLPNKDDRNFLNRMLYLNIN
jgi:hypothetical protein